MVWSSPDSTLAPALTVQEATLGVIWRSGKEVFAADAGRVLRDDPDDPMRTALRQVVGVFAELDRRMVVKRLRDGRLAKAAAGRKAVGAYPFGSQGAGRGRSRDAAPRPEERKVVEVIVDARNNGMTYRQIVRLLALNALKPRYAAEWNAMSVRAVCQREPDCVSYVGPASARATSSSERKAATEPARSD